MNIDELKKLVKHSTAVLVLDNGEPSFVILKYDTYKDLVLAEPVKEVKISHVANNHAINSANGSSPVRDREGSQRASVSYGMSKDEIKPLASEVESEVLERINKDILALKEEIEKEEKTLGVE